MFEHPYVHALRQVRETLGQRGYRFHYGIKVMGKYVFAILGQSPDQREFQVCLRPEGDHTLLNLLDLTSNQELTLPLLRCQAETIIQVLTNLYEGVDERV